MIKFIKEHKLTSVISLFVLIMIIMGTTITVLEMLKQDEITVKSMPETQATSNTNDTSAVTTTKSQKVDYTQKRLKREKEYFANAVTQPNQVVNTQVENSQNSNTSKRNQTVVEENKVEKVSESSNVDKQNTNKEEEIQKPAEAIETIEEKKEANPITTPVVEEPEANS